MTTSTNSWAIQMLGGGTSVTDCPPGTIHFLRRHRLGPGRAKFKRERWAASVTYVLRDSVKNNELAVNLLGLTMIRFRADQALSNRYDPYRDIESFV
jgi:hypothetical protein